MCRLLPVFWSREQHGSCREALAIPLLRAWMHQPGRSPSPDCTSASRSFLVRIFSSLPPSFSSSCSSQAVHTGWRSTHRHMNTPCLVCRDTMLRPAGLPACHPPSPPSEQSGERQTSSQLLQFPLISSWIPPHRRPRWRSSRATSRGRQPSSCLPASSLQGTPRHAPPHTGWPAHSSGQCSLGL